MLDGHTELVVFAAIVTVFAIGGGLIVYAKQRIERGMKLRERKLRRDRREGR